MANVFRRSRAPAVKIECGTLLWIDEHMPSQMQLLLREASHGDIGTHAMRCVLREQGGCGGGSACHGRPRGEGVMVRFAQNFEDSRMGRQISIRMSSVTAICTPKSTNISW